MATEPQIIIHKDEQPIKIEVERGMKGTYKWTIQVKETNVTNTLSLIEEADRKLKEKYGSEPKE